MTTLHSSLRLSIVTPSFNQAQFLERTLCSVLDQAYPNLEYIVIDGGSTDGSRQIIERYAPHLTYWESLPDRGQAHAINKGFARATGQVRAWLNSDDIYLPAALARVAEYFQDPQLDFLFGQRQLLDAYDRLIQPVVIPAWHPIHFLVYSFAALNQEACFWSTRLAARVGMLNESYHQALDYEFILRLCEAAGTRWRRTPEFLSGARYHPDQKSMQYDSSGRRRGYLEAFAVRDTYLRAHHIPRLHAYLAGLLFRAARRLYMRPLPWPRTHRGAPLWRKLAEAFR